METLAQEKILLHEETGLTDKIDQQVQRDLPLVRQLVATYNALGIFPKLTHLHDLERFRGDRPTEIEKALRNYIVDQSGTTIGGLTLSRAKLMEMVDLPANTGDFVNVVWKAFRPLSFDLANFILQDGKVTANETIVEAKKDQHRYYARTPAQLQRLSDLRDFADMINAAAERFGKEHFRGSEIPLLEGGYHPEKAENGISYTGKLLGSYRPSWRAVLSAK